MQMTLHGKAKRKQQLTSASYHTYTQNERKKTIKSRASPTHTHSYWCATVCTLKKSVLSQTIGRLIVSVLFGQSIWVKTRIRGHHFVEGGNNENCAHTHAYRDALIKHGSKKQQKIKRNERHHSLDSCIQ